MLKPPPSSALSVAGRPAWYQGLAERIHTVSPRLFSLLRFARRAAMHIISRRVLLVPLVLVSALLIGALAYPEFTSYRPWIIVGAAGGFMATLLAYVAFRSHAHAESLHIEVNELRNQLVTAQTVIARNVRESTQSVVDGALNNTILPRIEAVRATGLAERRRTNKLIREVDVRLAKGETNFEKLSATLKTVDDRAIGRAALAAVNDALTERMSKRMHAIEENVAEVGNWSQFNNAAWYQRFNRRLRADHIKELETQWRKRLSVPVSKALVGYMANRACEIERQLDGRLATAIEDVILRSLVARAVKSDRINVLEIGTLFGTGAAIMYDALANHYEQVHFTLLDPLEGYYNASQDDILTGQPIDERTLRRNLSRAGMTEDQFTLIKRLSTEPEAITEAGQREYDVLVIDADHSYAGVKTDFENYAQFVKLGGYIIFDDYSSPDWPDVQKYVDTELSDVDYITRVGASWRTCIYRMVKSPTSGRKSASQSKPRARKAPEKIASDPTNVE